MVIQMKNDHGFTWLECLGGVRWEDYNSQAARVTDQGRADDVESAYAAHAVCSHTVDKVLSTEGREQAVQACILLAEENENQHRLWSGPRRPGHELGPRFSDEERRHTAAKWAARAERARSVAALLSEAMAEG